MNSNRNEQAKATRAPRVDLFVVGDRRRRQDDDEDRVSSRKGRGFHWLHPTRPQVA